MTLPSAKPEAFVLQNQQGLFLAKQLVWIDGRDTQSLYKTLHKDEAVNQMVEVCSKDYTQRVKLVSCTLNEKGLPCIDSAYLASAINAPALADTSLDDKEAVTETPASTAAEPDARDGNEAAFSNFLQQSLGETNISR